MTINGITRQKVAFLPALNIQAMSTAQAFFILLLVVGGLVLAVWLLVRGWSPEQLPLWAGVIWGLMAVMVIVPKFLPASVRWSDTTSIVQMILGVVVLILSVKCLVLLIRHGAALPEAQRWAAYLGLVPLALGVLLVVFFFWMASAFNNK